MFIAPGPGLERVMRMPSGGVKNTRETARQFEGRNVAFGIRTDSDHSRHSGVRSAPQHRLEVRGILPEMKVAVGIDHEGVTRPERPAAVELVRRCATASEIS